MIIEGTRSGAIHADERAMIEGASPRRPDGRNDHDAAAGGQMVVE